MNKTYLAIGGTAVVSLATGAAGAYYFAKKKFDEELVNVLAFEIDKTRMHYEGLLEELQEKLSVSSGLEDTLSDEESKTDETEDEEDKGPGPQGPEEHELTPDDEKALAKGRHHLKKQAQTALVNYQGISTETKPPLSEVVKQSEVESHNIFTTAVDKGKKKPPPRAPRGDNGKFRKQTRREAANEPPQILDTPEGMEEFLLNDRGFDVEDLLYFINDNKTLVQENDPTEAVDINLIGEVNLTLFPDVAEGEPSIIRVRNEGMKVYYQVTRMEESLTERIGLGEYSDVGEGFKDDGNSFYES